MSFLVMTFDPCPEGGWHVSGEFDTLDEAAKAAKKNHKHEMKCIEKFGNGVVSCYSETMIVSTPFVTIKVPGEIMARKTCWDCFPRRRKTKNCKTCGGKGWVIEEEEE